jgi:hypothetical protein
MNTTPLVLGTILASLTGCTSPDKVTDSPSKDSDTDTDTDTTTYKGEVNPADYPQCEGDTGVCCVDVYCVEKTEPACPDPATLDASEVTGVGLGSGSCLCSPVDGPWQVEGEDGCCYLVGIQGCEGRPLRIDGHQRKASVQRGRRWARA